MSSNRRGRWTSLHRVLSVASIVLWTFVGLCYFVRFDCCALVTVFPAWVWLIPGLSLAVSESRRGNRRLGVAILGLWLAFLLWFADTPASLLRAVVNSASSRDLAEPDRALRVITLNCATSAEAAREVAEYRPDVVLLQESPSRKQLEALAQRLYGDEGGVVWGPDASIVARGCVTAVETPASLRGECAQARIRLDSGAEVTVVSLRLTPSTFRLDFWAPGCWKDYADNRRERRRQLLEMLQETAAIASSGPLVFGGDFNAAPGDAVFCPLRPRLVDAFFRAGVGWGGTILNDRPVLRIDQVWVSDHFSPTRVFAKRTRHSDHRMVVCDLTLDCSRITGTAAGNE
ncbi:MAG: endonuclease/exonuclease/phosphatase family protein [Planctomycetes bacterium]|nr:endonuclease/exonuclease/phosphatase family protein [Planctomycetota bacterium]